MSRYSLLLGVERISSASSVMPMMPFIGVRISWLMLARNSDLSRDASSAASRASTSSSTMLVTSTMPLIDPSAAYHG